MPTDYTHLLGPSSLIRAPVTSSLLDSLDQHSSHNCSSALPLALLFPHSKTGAIIWLHFGIPGAFKVPESGHTLHRSIITSGYGSRHKCCWKAAEVENQHSRTSCIFLGPPQTVNLATTLELGSELPGSHSQQGSFFHLRAYRQLAEMDLKNQSLTHTDLGAVKETWNIFCRTQKRGQLMACKVGEGYSEETVFEQGFEGHQIQRIKGKRCFLRIICLSFKIFLLLTNTDASHF